MAGSFRRGDAAALKGGRRAGSRPDGAGAADDQAFFTLRAERSSILSPVRAQLASRKPWPSSPPRPPPDCASARRPRWLASALVLAGCAGFMFFDLRTPPIILWDESRMAVNALEMHLSGHLRLVTTYGFQPDLWNTKPPLLIWLMDLSASVFGVSEWSLRLPSMIAAMGTLALVMSFTRRVTQSFLAGALAAVLLALSVLFFAEHGARTADYEALLCFLTTAYLYVLFFALHRRRPSAVVVLAAGGLIAAAILTKSVAGLLPGVGVALYLLVVGRWKRPLQSPWYVAAGVLAVGTGAAYFLLREHAAPGLSEGGDVQRRVWPLHQRAGPAQRTALVLPEGRLRGRRLQRGHAGHRRAPGPAQRARTAPGRPDLQPVRDGGHPGGAELQRHQAEPLRRNRLPLHRHRHRHRRATRA